MSSKLAQESFKQADTLFQGLKQVTDVAQRYKTLQKCQEWFDLSLQQKFDLMTVYRLGKSLIYPKGLVYKSFMEIETDKEKKKFYKFKAFQHLIPEKYEQAKSRDFDEKAILKITKEKGDIYLLDEQYDEALIEYSKCRANKKKEEINPDVWISMGIAYEKLYEIDLAIHYYSEYLSVNAEKNLKNAQNFKDGIENLEAALEFMGETEDNEKYNCYQSLGSAYLCRKDMDKGKSAQKALEYFEKILKQVPNDPAAKYGKGLCYTKQDKYAEAQNMFVQAYEQDTEFSLAILGEARLQYKQGNNEKTKDLVEHALKLDPEQAAALKQKGKALKQLNDEDWIPTMNKADAYLVQQGIKSGSKAIQDCREQEGNIEGKTNLISAKLDANQIELVEDEIQKFEEKLKNSKQVNTSVLNKLQLLQARISLKKVTNNDQNEKASNMVGQSQDKTDQMQDNVNDIASQIIISSKMNNQRDSGSPAQIDETKQKLLEKNQEQTFPYEIVPDQPVEVEIQKLKRLPETIKDDPEPCINLGLLLYNQKQYEESKGQFEESERRLKDPRYRNQQQNQVWLKRMEDVTDCCFFLVKSRIQLVDKLKKETNQDFEKNFSESAKNLKKRMQGFKQNFPQNQIKILQSIFDAIDQHKKVKQKEFQKQQEIFRINFSQQTDAWFRLGYDLLHSSKSSDNAKLGEAINQEEERVKQIKDSTQAMKKSQEDQDQLKYSDQTQKLQTDLKKLSIGANKYQEIFAWAVRKQFVEKALCQTDDIFKGKKESEKDYETMWNMTQFSPLFEKTISLGGNLCYYFAKERSDAQFEDINKKTWDGLNQLRDQNLNRAEVEFQIFKASFKIVQSQAFQELFKLLQQIPDNKEAGYEAVAEVFINIYLSPQPSENDSQLERKKKELRNSQLKDYQVERAFLHVQQIFSGRLIDWATAYGVDLTNSDEKAQPNPKENSRGTTMSKSRVANEGTNQIPMPKKSNNKSQKLDFVKELKSIRSDEADDKISDIIIEIALYCIVREVNEIDQFRSKINNKKISQVSGGGCFGLF